MTDPKTVEIMTVFLPALLSDNEFIRTLTGEPLRDVTPALLVGYDLVVQRLDQIPEIPQRIIRASWGDEFESYSFAPGEGHIKGIKCEITKNQWDRIDDWEFGEFGWFTPTEVTVTNLATGQAEKAMTLVMGEGQSFERKENSDDFNTYLMPRDKTLEIALKARQLYDERNGVRPEGNLYPGREQKQGI